MKASPVELLFPTMKITRAAFNAAQAYIDETVLQKGVVESYMYGFRAVDDPEHSIRELYFPSQLCAREGVEVDDPLFPQLVKEYRSKGLILSSWIHHHCYGALRPSGPTFPRVNDRDACENFLNKIGTENYKTYLQRESVSIDDFVIEEKEGEFFLQPKKPGMGFVLKLKDREMRDLAAEIEFIGTTLPVNYSYIGCIIMNPSIAPNLLVTIADVADKMMREIEEIVVRAPEHHLGKELQKDVCKDPYAGFFWRKWSSLNTSENIVRERQVHLEIIDTGEKEREREIIKKEVEERARKSLVTNSDIGIIFPTREGMWWKR